jgi:hypothetical protein
MRETMDAMNSKVFGLEKLAAVLRRLYLSRLTQLGKPVLIVPSDRSLKWTSCSWEAPRERAEMG